MNQENYLILNFDEFLNFFLYIILLVLFFFLINRKKILYFTFSLSLFFFFLMLFCFFLPSFSHSFWIPSSFFLSIEFIHFLFFLFDLFKNKFVFVWGYKSVEVFWYCRKGFCFEWLMLNEKKDLGVFSFWSIGIKMKEWKWNHQFGFCDVFFCIVKGIKGCEKYGI